ncbi:hypothetical protein ACD661_12380 [Legionella lytica]|uniref:Uncharacterized protein n=1 Tax=Legionella lytica TaxID=96232 RepID=A0ABW8DBK7_9GAMM
MNRQLIRTYEKLIQILKLDNSDTFFADWINQEARLNPHQWGSKNAINEDELNDDPELQHLLISILTEQSIPDFFQWPVFVPAKYLAGHIGKLIQYMDAKYPTLEKIEKLERTKKLETLVFHALALRVYKEIRQHEFAFPRMIDTGERSERYAKLCNQVAEIKIKLSNQLELDESSENKGVINIRSTGLKSNELVDLYSQDYRHLTVKPKQKMSVVDFWASPGLLHQLFKQLHFYKTSVNKNGQLAYSDYCRTNADKEDSDEFFSLRRLRCQLNQTYTSGHFEPLYVPYLITYLQNKYHSATTSLLDLCSGWGDRLMGAFISQQLGLQRYVGTDPNSGLQECYQNIIREFAPDGFETIIHDKPMEDLSEQELMPYGVRHQLMLTCPPYFLEEIYQGQEQSTHRYTTYALWKEKFLFKLLTQALMSMQVNGFIVLVVGDNNAHNIFNDLTQHLKETSSLFNYQGFFTIAPSHKQKIIITQCQPIPSLLSLPIHSYFNRLSQNHLTHRAVVESIPDNESNILVRNKKRKKSSEEEGWESTPQAKHLDEGTIHKPTTLIRLRKGGRFFVAAPSQAPAKSEIEILDADNVDAMRHE